MNTPVEAQISSEKGFYLGDLCYALDRELYHTVWGGQRYADGVFTMPNGWQFAVAHTAEGDGYYEDNQRRGYGVDSGAIGLVPLELLAQSGAGGQQFPGGGQARFSAQGGQFAICLPSGEEILLDTNSFPE